MLLDAVKQSMMKMMIGTRFIIRESQESMESPVKETHFIIPFGGKIVMECFPRERMSVA